MQFSKDKAFFKSLFHMLLIVSLQNVVTYSVNMADNLMLGNYSQNALSGAATVNQIQFMVQQLTVGGLTGGLVALASQYWGKKEVSPIRTLTGIALKWGMAIGLTLLVITTFFPVQLLTIFTNDQGIISAGLEYLHLMRFTYIFYIASTILLGALRSVKVVTIAFAVSLVSLLVNVSINYTLIFGHFGAPELGITGAAIGTLISRILEFLIVLCYMLFIDKRLALFKEKFWKTNTMLSKDYFAYTKTVSANAVIWALATPVQTAILGHLSADAIAANSVATTMYQYLKVIVIGESSSTAVSIGNLLGAGVTTKEKLRPYLNSIQAIFLAIGLFLGAALFFIRIPLLSFYALSDSALTLANSLLVMMVFIFIGMAYQMPLGSGVIQGGGDAKFSMRLNFISSWLIVIPFAFMAAFWWKLPVFWIVFILNSDQIFKCIPIAIHANNFKWVRILTR